MSMITKNVTAIRMVARPTLCTRVGQRQRQFMPVRFSTVNAASKQPKQETATASDDFAGEADGRNLGNEPTGDVPKGTNPRKFFTTGDDSQKSKEHFNKEWKDNAKHNSFPGTDPNEKH
ncbi:hypothetical protein PROFUN_12917 [Planoprotostelium fungivorum]|uniref:Uncharacterized protein n=1 Tax=Planoprotostelium fungivorum TaxID=1890364 RepID=A0A2P6N600_9EUKA|nr:hypothetical protein PROFUN_12917 [Planoprotostelium fungivorum]